VQPLVDDLNALLAEREARVQRALAKAGDLAHGLKTPLAVLARDADRATASGDVELASSMAAQVERMRRQIDYHLAHARAAAAGNVPGTRSLLAALGHRIRGNWRSARRSNAAFSGAARPCRPLRARRSRRDARQSARQRLQVGRSRVK
jgi:hypothetical protein